MSAEKLLIKIKLAEQAERYEQMAKHCKALVQLGNPLSDEQRNLVSVAYKNKAGALRSAWRIISTIETKKVYDGSEAKEAREEVEGELREVISELVGLLDGHLLASANSVEAKVFYLKMKGDYYKYLAEIEQNDKREESAAKSEQAYLLAIEAANELPATHPIKLGLALNYSTFHYEIRNDGPKACEIAKKAFDEAIGELDSLKEDSYKDSTLIMQLLRDNLTLWTSENGN